MFFKKGNRNRGEDLNRKVEKYKRWWQDRSQDGPSGSSNSSKKTTEDGKPFDSSFVYYEEG
ncbi:MAG: hypothetical protein JSV10_07295 [Candidatus Zixiibacteriota bacterium]|nr:MAG: hypothetical protein JSV10_07295 [candidate division Zixibacteria bacterium]